MNSIEGFMQATHKKRDQDFCFLLDGRGELLDLGEGNNNFVGDWYM